MKYKSLFIHNTITLPEGIKVINTTPHSLTYGNITIPAGNPKIVELFAAEKVFVETGDLKSIPLGYYVYIVPEDIKQEVIKTLEDLDVYALGSVITTLGFNHPRVIKLEKNGSIKFIIPRGVN